MTPEAVAIMVLGTLSGVIAWIARSAIRDLRELERAHAEHMRTLPIEYVRNEPYRRDMDELKSMLGKVLDKLEQKADKE